MTRRCNFRSRRVLEKVEETAVQTHVRALAILQIVYASIGLFIALAVFLIFGGIAAIVGVAAEPHDSIVAVPILSIIGTVSASFIALLSLPRLIAGIGLLQYRNWARILTIVVSAIGLADVPFGTALGVYGIWVLVQQETARLFDTPSVRMA
jgi:hypothetical protein